MGEVYKAMDTRLDRIVAIKVLPPAVSTDPERKLRFEREAKTVAALSHPHICPVFDVGSEGGIDFLVMEYLDGETLEQRLKGGALPPDQAIRIGIQLADALAAAHRAGIVHRDLKPGNVILTKGGAKLLDFGLAKTSAPAVAGNLSMLPTTPPNLTAQGTILGTFQYMAPEQLEGHEVDHRTDIFAFGSVLYEMVTGQKAFQGKSQASLIAGILEREPSAMSSIQPLTPAALDHVVGRCLAKDPEERWQTAGDLMRELRWIGTSRSDERQTRASAGATRGQISKVFRWSIGVAAIAVAAAIIFRPSTAPPSGLPTRLVVSMPPTHDVYTGGGGVPAISADGRTLVYIGVSSNGGRRLYRRFLDQLDPFELPGPPLPVQPSISPDGKWVSFNAASRLFRVGVDGGNLERVTEAVTANFGTTWADDNTIIFTGTDNGVRRLFRVTTPGGSPTPFTTPPSAAHHLYPQAAGSLVAFDLWTGVLEEAKVVVRSLSTGEERVLLDGTSPHILPTGHLVFARQNALWAVPFDAARLEVTGTPTRIVDDLQVNSGGLALYAVSNNGTLVYIRGTSGAQRTLVSVDRQGRETTLAVTPKQYESVRVSWDGSRAVLDTNATEGDLWLWDNSRSIFARLTSRPARDTAPEWAPDSKRVVFTSERAGAQNLFLLGTDGAEEPEPLLESHGAQTALSFTHKGELLFRSEGQDGSFIQLASLGAGLGPAERLMPAIASERNAVISPDGAWMAYESDESGQTEIIVRSFPNTSRVKRQVSNGGGSQPVWSRRGDELYFVRDGAVYRVPVNTGATFDFGDATLLVRGGRYHLGEGRRRYDVAADGQSFFFIKESASEDIVVVQHWFEELKRLAPTK
jgi:serine/threonine-protein kinase